YFWGAPGVIAGLTTAGFGVHAPMRAQQPCSWRGESDHLAARVPSPPVRVVAGSNGCSAAARLAIDHVELVRSLVLCWPATNLPLPEWPHLVRGETLRGVADDELRALSVPIVLVPSAPFNPYHDEATFDRVLGLVPGARRAAAFPETPMPHFPPRRDAFVAELVSILRDL
ncbi:MAG TPA: hypothetical protein VEA78_06545, partial [Acidimicrobiales bacterium]|nr:hypothetical protein [Acidimicrobiales bacterium]